MGVPKMIIWFNDKKIINIEFHQNARTTLKVTVVGVGFEPYTLKSYEGRKPHHVEKAHRHKKGRSAQKDDHSNMDSIINSNSQLNSSFQIN